MVFGCTPCNDGDCGRNPNGQLVAQIQLWIAQNKPLQVTCTGQGNEYIVINAIQPNASWTVTHGTFHDTSVFLEKFYPIHSGGVNTQYKMGWKHCKNVQHTGTASFIRHY